MGIGLFRKKTTAELVLTNGRVHTMNPDHPLAEAVACAAGKIVSVGTMQDVEAMITENTTILDLEGRDVTPGRIALHSNPIPSVFKEQYLQLTEKTTGKEILRSLIDFIGRHPKEERYLAYGYDASLVTEEEISFMRQTINAESPEIPVILVASDGLHMILNAPAAAAAAAEADVLGMPAVTPALVTSVLLSADIATLLENLSIHMFQQAQKGITSEFVRPSFTHFENIYRELLVDAYQAHLLRQRYFGSLLINAPIPERLVLHHMAQKHTACAELNGLIQFRTLVIRYSSIEGSSHFMSEAYVRQLCTLAADKGYHIRIAASDHFAAVTALQLLSELKTSYKRSAFSVEHDETLTEEERASILTAEIYEYAAKTPSGPGLMPDAQLEEDTVRAAERLGLAAECGSIEPGKWADMAVFEDDPTASATISPTTRMTIVNGQIVYDSQNDSPEKWNRKIRKTVFQGE